MELNRQIPCITSGERRLSLVEAEAALEHASAFIRLAESIAADRFGVAAREWLEKYVENAKAIKAR